MKTCAEFRCFLDDKTSLIEQLRIDRPAEDEPAAWPKWVAIAVTVLAIAGVAIWLLLPRGIPVRAAVVEVAPAEAAAGPGTILDASGYVVARRQATVSSKITGKVVQVSIEEGQRVARDEIIARLDDTNARAALEQARAARAQARGEPHGGAGRVRQRRADLQAQRAAAREGRDQRADVRHGEGARTTPRAPGSTSRSARRGRALGRELAERNLDDTVVRAPFAGIVTVKAAQEGEMVSPISAGGGFTRTGIGTIVDMDSLEIEVDVSENFINRVHPDQAVTARLNAYPDWAIPAHVIAIIPTADRAKATVKVRVGFDARDDRILPEMGVRVAFLDTPTSAPTESASAAAAQRALRRADGRRAGERRHGRRVRAERRSRRAPRGATRRARRRRADRVVGSFRRRARRGRRSFAACGRSKGSRRELSARSCERRSER